MAYLNTNINSYKIDGLDNNAYAFTTNLFSDKLEHPLYRNFNNIRIFLLLYNNLEEQNSNIIKINDLSIPCTLLFKNDDNYIEEKITDENLTNGDVDLSTIPSLKDKTITAIYMFPDFYINDNKIIKNDKSNVGYYHSSSKYIRYEWVGDVLIYPSYHYSFRVNFKSKGSLYNVGGEDNGLIFSKHIKLENDKLSSNVEGVKNPFNDDDEINLSKNSDSENNSDIWHTFEFEKPTPCYSLNIKYAKPENAPTELKIEGSKDNETFTLLKFQKHNISIENYEQEIKFDSDTFDTYKFYKVSILKGTKADTAIELKNYSLNNETTRQPLLK